MYVCAECRAEMRCEKNGVGADFGNGHVYPGDRYVCPVCNHHILTTNIAPTHDPDYRFQEEYLKMRRK